MAACLYNNEIKIEELREICLSFPKVTEDIKWEEYLCFNIGGKMFLISSPDNFPVSVSFKTNDDDFGKLINAMGFKPAPYLARNKWVYLDDINRLQREEWKIYIKKSYDLIFSKLPLKIKKQIIDKKVL